MKTYPYHTPDGIIQLVEKREIDQLIERLAKAEELLREIRDDEVNAQDEADRFLRDHQPSELAKMRAANAELLERLAEARESHLAASARDVQTIQRQAIMLERFAKALGRCTFKDWFTSDDTGEVIVALDAGEVRSALSAYKSASVEPASSRDVQTIQRQAIMLERLADALRAINSLEGDELIPSDNVWSDASVAAFHESITALAAYESAKGEQP